MKPGLRSLLARDFAAIRSRDPAARGALETALCYPGLHATVAYRLANVLWRRGFRFGARIVSYLARAVTGIDIHPGATIGPGFFIDHGAGVVIGETAEVGADVTLYHGVTLGGVSWSPGKRHPTLGDGSMVGAGAKILGPVTIGAGVRVGANSVVVSDVPDDATVIGIPARIVRTEIKPSADPLRVNLDHHLMPDPVGRALARLADRVAFLEARLNARQGPVPPVGDPERPRPINCHH
ncbi:serine O-acetyltransferase [Tropicimonas isoalkanivorans]|uniref:serine O-acetyltransferase n=1 Tax=Tropicimonas isoalkanivorans TaxID=441112 RepID=A0A1I1H7L7_9RHOB|nr:serine O-acetyltransferase [Tropicimonas isoalkanivorans]SFC19582.1 serine O-acetyltransferase [Tropicimonas isoalkanivorans]